MTSKIATLRECFLTLWTSEGSLPSVLSEMVPQIAALLEDWPAASVTTLEIQLDAHGIIVAHLDCLMPIVWDALKCFWLCSALLNKYRLIRGWLVIFTNCAPLRIIFLGLLLLILLFCLIVNLRISITLGVLAQLGRWNLIKLLIIDNKAESRALITLLQLLLLMNKFLIKLLLWLTILVKTICVFYFWWNSINLYWDNISAALIIVGSNPGSSENLLWTIRCTRISSFATYPVLIVENGQ